MRCGLQGLFILEWIIAFPKGEIDAHIAFRDAGRRNEAATFLTAGGTFGNWPQRSACPVSAAGEESHARSPTRVRRSRGSWRSDRSRIWPRKLPAPHECHRECRHSFQSSELELIGRTNDRCIVSCGLANCFDSFAEGGVGEVGTVPREQVLDRNEPPHGQCAGRRPRPWAGTEPPQRLGTPSGPHPRSFAATGNRRSLRAVPSPSRRLPHHIPRSQLGRWPDRSVHARFPTRRKSLFGGANVILTN